MEDFSVQYEEEKKEEENGGEAAASDRTKSKKPRESK